MFVWLFHRASAVLLIILVGLKLYSGFVLSGEIGGPDILAQTHNIRVLDFLLLFSLVFHSFYGIRSVLLDLGATNERLLFWMMTVLGAVVVLGSSYFVWLR